MAVCKGCGKKMFWGKTAEGMLIPLDPTPPVYRPALGLPLDKDMLAIERIQHAAVSHFATCSAANQFSRNRKEEAL